jgi:putative component of membrane protein insertase Oxa1/YidC/SpoIIIJ protein YidD
MTPAGRLVDSAIRAYQLHVSPRKGWRCAHRALHGDASCSGAVREILRRQGLLRGAAPTVRRFVACFQAAQLLAQTDVQGVCCCGGIPIPFRFPLRS